MTPVKSVIKGRTPTLLDTEKANEIIVILNALISAQIAPQGIGKLVLGKDQIVFDFAALALQLVQIKTAVNGLIASLQNPNFSISCNSNGTITASLSFTTPQQIT